jgi:hypothetical protein
MEHWQLWVWIVGGLMTAWQVAWAFWPRKKR